MDNMHPLDRPVWSALSSRQSSFAVVDGGARRYDPSYAVFAAAADRSRVNVESIGTLAKQGYIGLLEVEPPTEVPGTIIVSHNRGVQMPASHLFAGPSPDAEITVLGDADAPEMLALAALTKPWPFFARTHHLGDFFGIRADGRLAAMAGERMKLDGFTEVSGVCTHPDYRGRGYAAALMRLIAGRVFGRGEVPFLHAYANNHGAIALYELLGFSLRAEVQMIRLTRARGLSRRS